MKRAALVLLALLVGVNFWLVLRQQGMKRDLETLRGANLSLAQELAQRPNLSPEEMSAVTRRLENAGAFIDAVEGRLTNASALLSQLQTASQRYLAPGTGSANRPRPNFPAPGSGGASGAALPVAGVSSHAPDGQLLQRNWGPEQVLGPPNTHAAGDIPTAWAPLSSRGGAEWLQVNYDRAVDISEIRVRETYNPGAIAKVVAVLPNGREAIVWEGVTPPVEAPIDTAFGAPAGLQAQSVKIYFDRTRAPGWNEIDAVELVGRDGSRQWASSAAASSSFAEQLR
jgi:hypothetical protein